MTREALTLYLRKFDAPMRHEPLVFERDVAPDATPDVATQLENARCAGFAEGRAAGMLDGSAAFEEERRVLFATHEDDRAAWVAETAANVAERFDRSCSEGLSGIEQRLVSVLAPFLVGAARAKAIRAALECLNKLLRGGGDLAITITSPPNLARQLGDALASHNCSATIKLGESPELVLTLDDTIIETRLREWGELLDGGGL